MALWLDAADPSSMTFSSGSNVSAWRDKSGNSQSFTVTGTPTLTSNAQNGSSAVTFNGTSYFYNTTLSTPIASHTSFVVAKFTGTGYYGIVSFTSGAVSSYQSPNAFRYAGQGGTTLTNDMLDVYANNGAYQILTSVATNDAFLFCEQTSNTTPYPTGSMYYNGSIPNVTSSAQFNYTPGTATGVVVGSYWYSSTSNANFIGNIYEVISYNQTLTTSQRQQIEGYLAHKWGLNTNLVGGLTKPTQIPGCALWLDGADASTLTFSSGSNVSVWGDKSGNGSNATAAGTVPTFSNSAVNFGGAGYFATGVSAASSNESVFIVTKYSSSSANAVQGLLGQTANGGRFLGGYKATSSIQGSSYNVANGSVGPTGGAPVDVTFIGEMITTAGSQIVYTNGANPGTTVSVTYTAGATTVLGVGFNLGSPNSAQYLLGSMNEVLIFNTALNTTQRQSVEGYLATKWGLRAALPATHPSYTGIAAQPFALMRPFTRAFQPVDIPGLALWLDAGDGSSLTFSSGSNVSVWKDKSGNGTNYVQATTANQPTYIYDSTYSNSGIFFGGINNTTSHILTPSNTAITPISNSTGSFTIFTVHRFGVYNAGFGDLYRGQSGSGLWLRASSASNTTPVYANNYITITTPVNGVTAYSGDTTTGLNFFLNGTSAGTATKAAGAGSVGNIVLGASLAAVNPSSESFNGFLFEFLIFNTALTTSQRQQVEGYLAWKWGLNSQLPGVPLNPQWQSGLALWLDAADSSTLTFSSGSNISTWRDKATGISCVASNSPTLVVNSQNGLPVVNFVGTSTQFFTAVRASGFPSVKTYFMVYSNSLSNVGQTLLGGSVFTQQGGGTTFQDESGYTSGTPAFQTGGSYRIVSSLPIATAASPSLNGSVFMNGSQISLISSSGNYVPSGTTIYIGTGNQPYTGTIAEFILFNNALTTSQRQGIETYLARKWGLTVPTSTPHPFFRLPATSPLPFSPLGISGCALWLDAADQSSMTFSSGSNIATWNDKSGNARNATNAGTGNPLWATSIINGVPAIQFNDGNFLTTPSFTMDTITRTAFVVYRHTANTFPADGVYYNFYPLLGSNTNGFQLYTFRMNTSPYNWGAGLGITSVGGFPDGPAYFSGNTQPANPNFLICGQRSSSNTGVITYNGTSQSTNFANTTSLFPATDILRVGRTTTNTGSGNIAGHYIGEILLYNTALTAAQRQSVEGYLSQKWGISVPTTHPFSKFSPPAIP
jgi:hypothetical protein